MALVGDGKATVGQLNKALDKRQWFHPKDTPWRQAIAKKTADNAAQIRPQIDDDQAPAGYYRALRDVAAWMPRDTILSAEGASTMDIGLTQLPSFNARSCLNAGTYGTMGGGLGQVIAACVAHPDRPVIHLSGDNGLWAFEPNLQTRFDELLEKYQGLVKRWNRFVNEYNGVIRRRPVVGRPLNASDAQCARVIKLRKGGMSIRAIMDETNLGMQTVRTILGRESWTDRASKKRLERIDHKPVSDLAIRVKARKRVRDALPTRINKVLAEGADLIKETKGLGK